MGSDNCSTNWEHIERALATAFDTHDAAVLIHIEPLRVLFEQDPDAAFEQIVGAYHRSMDTAYTNESGENVRSLIESMVGPFEGEGRAVSNIVGSFYPHFNRERQDRALTGLLNIYDSINSGYVNGGRGEGITEGIHEPLLLRDIDIVRPGYWPGLYEGERLLKKNPEFAIWQNEFLTPDGRFIPRTVKSEFLVAYALLRSDMSTLGEAYAEYAEPAFLERTLRAIVGSYFGGAIKKEKDKKEIIAERTSHLRELLPPALHERIDAYRDERGWVDWKVFNPRHADTHDSLL
jgi:hypothetical protein